MNALPSGRSSAVSPWLLDRDVVYAITAQKRVSPEKVRGANPTTRGTYSSELGRVTGSELCELTGLGDRELLLLVDYGVLGGMASTTEPREFATSLVPVLRRAQRMHEDLALTSDEFVLATVLLLEIDKMEAELRWAKLSSAHGTRSPPDSTDEFEP